MSKIASILTFNFIDVMNNCPYNENIHKCTDIYSSPDKDCLSTVCARKQAYYYHLLSKQLKAELESIKGLLKTNAKVQAELLTENEKLKEEIRVYGATGICETCTEKANLEADKLKLENQKLKSKKDEYYLTNLEYERQISDLVNCLEEIKNITKKQYRSLISERDCISCDDRIKAILDKISEVINE